MRLILLFAFLTQAFLGLAQSVTHPEFVYTSPRPNSTLHHPSTNVILRSSTKLSKHRFERSLSFSVEGGLSGEHLLDLTLCKDRKTIVLDPVNDFSHNELVTVRAKGSGGATLIEFRFKASGKNHKGAFLNEIESQSFNVEKSSPALEYTITNNSNPAKGNVFFSTFGQPQRPVNILDSMGSVLYTEDFNMEGWEWKVNMNGHLTFFDRATDGWVVMDSMYSRVDTVFCLNGYTADYHEIVALPNGNYLIMAYDLQEYAMDTVVSGGDPNATVEGLIIQELDSDHNLIFQWRSWDHFAVTDNTYLNLTHSDLRFIHGNSIDVDFDGHLILSCRDLDEITKVHRQTGDVIWRLGGSQSDFTYDNTYPFTGQHCARSVGENKYLLFDNGKYSAQYNGDDVSRALEFEIDTVNMTITKVWEFLHPDDLFSVNLGSVQRLQNGNTLMAFGNLASLGRGAIILEADSNEQITFELECAFGQSIYRAHKHDWFFANEIVGCTDPLACNYDPMVIIPDSSCMNQMLPTTIAQNGNTLTAISDNTSSLYQYEWSTGESEQNIVVSEDGEYWVIVHGANECESDTSFFDVVILQIDATGVFDASKVVRVFDIMGRPATEKNGRLLFYQMSDGTILKRLKMQN
ncbi:MAG: hypothetical protein ACI9FU_001305 [Granulosicoccus sp.]|jgi:hypothetical protein